MHFAGRMRAARRTAAVRITAVLGLGVWLLWPCAAAAREKQAEKEASRKLPNVAEKVRGLVHRKGLLDLYLEPAAGKVWLALPPPQGPRGVTAELIYVEGLASGLGSNPVGLDRGQLNDSVLLEIRRLGNKVLLEQRNLGFRAQSDDEAERRAVVESFAGAVLWGGEIGALDGNGRSLVDLTSFLIRDAHRIAARVAEAGQGSFVLDPGRSAVDLESCLAFPDNLELEAVLTYAATAPAGPEVRATSPSPDAFTLVQHHSFVRLPEPGYQPRRGDPRIGMYGLRFLDYATPIDAPLRVKHIARFRLEKLDPAAERSAVREPIVLYVDRGAPEPVRSALVEGASWWAAAFEAAGFIDAYRVELLPADAHPLDVRYNVIQWVHRATRGWSYGTGISDPRTGEILKGHVNLGSLRVRHDRLLFEGLLGTEATGSGRSDDPVLLALARIRQLAAHEVGHALGLTHNFAASTYDGRASVMDYPAPLVEVTPAGELDVSRVYATGVGSWDLHTIRYAYAQFAPGVDEETGLEAIVREGLARGLLFLSDDDARPPEASDPRANLWDNGDDPIAALDTVLAVRRIALARFGERNVAVGRPLAELEEVLAPLYFHHRYQLEATAKLIGGLEYHFAVRGDGQSATRQVEGDRQRRALAAVLGVLDPEQLDLPDSLLALLPPRPYDWPRHPELFASSTLPAFDPLGAAATAADGVATLLLEPHRIARLEDFHRRDPGLPGAEEVVGGLIDRAFAARAATPRLAAIERAVERAVADRLLSLAGNPQLPPAVRAWDEWGLRRVLERLGSRAPADASARAHRDTLRGDVERFLDRRSLPAGVPAPAPPMPPGSPIGGWGEP